MEYIASFPVTSALIGANIVASLIAFVSPDFYEQNLFRVGPVRQRGEWHRIITSGFLHVNVLHLVVNMYVLYMFGPILEQALGAGGYLLVYFAALVGGSLWMLADKRHQPDYAAVGASGAVSGVILAFCLFAPLVMLYLFFAIPMPAAVFGIGFILVSAWLSGRDNAMIAHGAHLGGALAGLGMAILLRPEAVGRFFDQIAGGI